MGQFLHTLDSAGLAAAQRSRLFGRDDKMGENIIFVKGERSAA